MEVIEVLFWIITVLVVFRFTKELERDIFND